MTAAEQLALALQRVIEEAVDVGRNSPADVDLKMAEAGRALGFHTSTVLRLCLNGQLESTGKGRARRVPMSAIAAYKARNRNTRRVNRSEDTATATSGPPTH